MKKMMTVAMMILVAACCFAGTFKITLLSRVEKMDPQFVIRNTETGASGASVVYITDEIAKGDVRTGFDVIQSTNSNGVNIVDFTVSATELVARVGGRTYSTEGAGIVIDGVNHGAVAQFTRATVGAVAAGAVVESFEVVWPTSAALVQATYEACVTLSATAR